MKQQQYFIIVFGLTLLIFVLAGCGKESVKEEQRMDMTMPWEDPWFLPQEAEPSLKSLDIGYEVKWPRQQWAIYQGFISTKPLMINDELTKAYEIDVAEEGLKPVSIQSVGGYYVEQKHGILQIETGDQGVFVVSKDQKGRYHLIHHWGDSLGSREKLMENQMVLPEIVFNSRRDKVLYFDDTEDSLYSYHVIKKQSKKIAIKDKTLKPEEWSEQIRISPQGGYLLVDAEKTDSFSAGFSLYGTDSGRELISHIPGTYSVWGKDDQIIVFRFEETLQMGIYFRERRQMTLLGQANPDFEILEGPLVAKDGHHALYVSKDQNQDIRLHILHLQEEMERTHILPAWDGTSCLKEDVYFYGEGYLIFRIQQEGKSELFIQDNRTGNVSVTNVSDELPMFFLVGHQIYYFVDQEDKINMMRTDLNTTQKIISHVDVYDRVSKVNMETGVIVYLETTEKEKSAWLIQ